MSQVPQHLIEEARKRGIVPGAIIECAVDGTRGTVGPIDEWVSNRTDLQIGHDEDGCALYARAGNWANVIIPAPSEPEGLREGDAVECGPAMRAAIIELAKELGVKIDDSISVDPLQFPNLGWADMCDGLVGVIKNPTRYTPIPLEAFIAKLRVTAALPKPEPPIKIGSDKVEFRSGSIRVGCTTVDNATVRSIAEKLID